MSTRASEPRGKIDDMTHLQQRVNPSDDAAQRCVSLLDMNTAVRDLSASS
jgi:hypothetical protein